jgi:quinohemoprotein ethanol dehydrogenase
LRRIAPWLALATLILAACHRPGPGVGAAADWTGHGGDASESNYSQLDDITKANVGRLGLAWSLDLPGEVSLEATPLAVGGVLYFTGSYGKVYAVDGAKGTVLWTHDPEIWNHDPAKMHLSFGANRGAAYAQGRVFAATLDGRLLALDAGTGKLLWQVQTVSPQAMQFITGAPRTFNGKVIIGQGGADFGARGYVTAYDQATGKQVWRFYAAPGSPEQNKGDPAMEKAAATWTGDYWKTGTGGGAWDSITFDPDLNRIYIGTANASPYDPEQRSPGGGDNLYTASIVALDADTGKYAWHYQVNPRDSWDYDSTQQMTLATLIIDGKPRKVLMQAPKNGFLYVIDRESGKLISAGKIGKATWADHIDLATGRPVEEKDIRYETGETIIWPAPAGAHSWQSMSFSPKTGLLYIPYMQVGIRFVRGEPQPGGFSLGTVSLKAYEADPQDGKGALLAYDPVRQKVAWKAQHDQIWNGGVVSTAGDLVFQGTADGIISAYNAVNGERLWRFDAGLGVIAPPMTWSAGGKQYVSVLVGYGGSSAIWGDLMNVGWKWGAQPRRLLTFALDGKATLAPSPPRDMTVKALDDPKLTLDPKDVAAGHDLYNSCAACHGLNLVSSGAPAPDLRESPTALDPESFWTVLHEGSLIQQGMPKFEDLTREQAMQIYAYIRAGARQALGKPAPVAQGTQPRPGPPAPGAHL